jgi:hypothetical protein
VGAEWDLRKITPLGQQVTFTAYSRADAYHTDDIEDTVTTAIYRGTKGWQGRGIIAGAVDIRWPFVGSFLGGTQQIDAARPVRRIAVRPRISPSPTRIPARSISTTATSSPSIASPVMIGGRMAAASPMARNGIISVPGWR